MLGHCGHRHLVPTVAKTELVIFSSQEAAWLEDGGDGMIE